MRTALKEWAVLVNALARGDIIAMVRKGGIRERRAGFTVRHDRFALYPTYFHETPAGLAPRFAAAVSEADATRPPEGTVRITHVADVAASWIATDLDALRGIAHEHGLAWSAVESRFHYGRIPGVHVVALAVSRLDRAAELPERRRYAGCVSWLELDTEIEANELARCIAPPDLERRVHAIARVLGEPERPSENRAA